MVIGMDGGGARHRRLHKDMHFGRARSEYSDLESTERVLMPYSLVNTARPLQVSPATRFPLHGTLEAAPVKFLPEGQ